jgi:hypothetical protein
MFSHPNNFKCVQLVHLGIARFGSVPPILPVQSKNIIGPFSEDADFYDTRELVQDKSKWQH